MARCCSCSAPLPSDTSRCRYCGTRNDLDFLAVGRFTDSQEASGHLCPQCQISLKTIRLTPDGAFVIERCQTCFGLFFNPGQVQAFLDSSVAKAFNINFKEIVNISRERANKDRRVRYLKCPECGKFMNRVNFGYRSGVVLDQCMQHGVWLENGELIHLMEWKKAGGQLLDEQQKAQSIIEAEQRKARRTAKNDRVGSIAFDSRAEDAPADLAQAAFALLSKLIS